MINRYSRVGWQNGIFEGEISKGSRCLMQVFQLSDTINFLYQFTNPLSFVLLLFDKGFVPRVVPS
jgi:hypothetical protein